MHTKVQASSKNDGNKGSCRDLVYYLEKENRAESRGEERKHPAETFFSHTQDNVPSEQVIHSIDSNIKKLGKDDSKFFEIYVSPSKAELDKIGNDSAKLKEYIRKEVMGAYANGFGIRSEKELQARDLVYFGKIERERRYKGNDPEVLNGHHQSGEIKHGNNMHVHVIVSRKDQTNKIKLSPMASERGDTDNAMLNGKAVQRGFNRMAFSEKAEHAFDRAFDYKRNINQSFSYLNTMKHGNSQEQAAMRKMEISQARQTTLEQANQKNQTRTTAIPDQELKIKGEEKNGSSSELSI